MSKYAPEAHEELTPLMKQYWDLKAQAPDAILLFRMGDFYEVFAEDALEAAKILEITLTSRDKGKANPMPMAGVPHHSIQSYLQKLLDHGKKVALGEQVEDPEEAKKRGSKSIVRREITRIFTPAVQFDSEGSQTSYLATALPVESKSTPARFTLALLDPSTGDTRLSLPLDEAALTEEVSTLPIRHFLRVGHQLPKETAETLTARSDVLFEEIPANRLSMEQAKEQILSQYQVGSLEAFLENGSDLDSATLAMGHLLHYLSRTQKTERLSHVRIPQALHAARVMKLGPRTANHLDLIPQAEQNAAQSLYSCVNQTKSALGARLLRRWIQEPLRTANEIQARQSATRELSLDTSANDKFQAQLAELYDLERILARVNTGLANPRDTYALGRSLSALSGLTSLLVRFQSAPLVDLRSRLRAAEEATRELASEILRTQVEAAPLVSRDAGIFQKGTHPDLDRLIDLTTNGQKWLVDLEAGERERTGIPSLKVRYNRVFGYYIEVTSANLKNVPTHYQRKQTTVGAERFFTEELKKFEDEIVSAEGKQKALELELFQALLAKVQAHARAITEAATACAELDVLVSLSRLAWETGWTYPEIDHSMDLEILAGRHPLVDQGRGNFVPNDLKLSATSALSLLITGPNMGGKSTVMRQVALIVILGQMGAPVPAASARWGVVSSIYTRIGAHDAIARGQSTFMVEMTELAHILHHADARSLVVLDEIGRGTSTYDGISVAWSAFEWIVTKLGCRTLFATHYHELTKLPNFLPRVANAHMAVESTRGNLRFLYQLREGAANESFGIQVAKLAGLPTPVISRAWKVLSELEEGATGQSQLSLFSGNPPEAEAGLSMGEVLSTESVTHSAQDEIANEISRELTHLSLNEMTPIQALTMLHDFQKRVMEKSAEA